MCSSLEALFISDTAMVDALREARDAPFLLLLLGSSLACKWPRLDPASSLRSIDREESDFPQTEHLLPNRYPHNERHVLWPPARHASTGCMHGLSMARICLLARLLACSPLRSPAPRTMLSRIRYCSRRSKTTPSKQTACISPQSPS